MTYAQGDLNGDGSVNGSDFAILAGNFGKTVPQPAAVGAAAVAHPKPTAAAPSAERTARPARRVVQVRIPTKTPPTRPAPRRRLLSRGG
jgi:hypothetical protein